MAHKNQSKKTETSFDYASFEKAAIGKLLEGKDLIGPEGILKEIIGRIVHAALDGEMDAHLAEDKSSEDEERRRNRRNGSTQKRLKTSVGEVQIHPPRDRNGDFEPLLVGKWDRNLNSGLDAQVIALYSQGNSVEEIREYVEQMYGATLSAGQITAITDKVWDEVLTWKQRVLQSFYVLIYLDAIYFRIRENGQVQTKAIYTVYGIDAQGERDILDIHIGQGDGEGAKEWGRLLEKIRARGVQDVLFFSVDGLEGFSEAIWEVFPQSVVQRCIVHMIRTSLKFVASKDFKAISQDLRRIYTADVEDAALMSLITKSVPVVCIKSVPLYIVNFPCKKQGQHVQNGHTHHGQNLIEERHKPPADFRTIRYPSQSHQTDRAGTGGWLRTFSPPAGEEAG